MSNKTESQTDKDKNHDDDESTGFFSLEAKAGLSLICILICGFSFMVWQQWKHQQTESVANQDSGEPSESAEDEEIVLQPNSDSDEKLVVADEKKAKNTEADFDPFGQQSEPPVSTKITAAESQPELKSAAFPDDDPFAQVEIKNQPKKANIPTLEVPADSNPVVADSPAESTELESKPDPFDPFGEDVLVKNSTTKSKTEQPQEKPATSSDAFDPFGEELKVTKTQPDSTDNQPPAKLPEMESSPKIAETPKTSPAELDPFATAEDPFGKIPAKNMKTNDADADKAPLVKSDDDPFFEPAEGSPAIIPKQGDAPAVADAGTFQDPLPILEPVPNSRKPTEKSNPFGEFDSIPAGSAQASSATNVSPEFPTPKTKGTLADLDSIPSSPPKSKELSSLMDTPFSEPSVKQKSQPFHLQADGTYQVQSGDNYWSISRQAYGSPLYYRALAEFNERVLPNPENMTAGTRIQIPSTDELERRYPRLVSTKPSRGSTTIVKASAEQNQKFFNADNGTPMYRVQKNDTLTGIAQNYLGRASRWIQIYELNRNILPNPNDLKIGTLLKLPHDASRVKFVRE